jgi:tetratricopeptide (TPR) repeat protein
LSALNSRAFEYNAISHHQHALQDVERAVSLQPRFANPYTHRGIAFFLTGRYAEAQAAFQESLALLPSHQRAREGLQACRQVLSGHDVSYYDPFRRIPAPTSTTIAAANTATSASRVALSLSSKTAAAAAAASVDGVPGLV